MLRVLAFIGILIPQSSLSQVTMRTGDHANFTRIVMAIPEGVGWTVGRIPSGYGVLFDQKLQFDPQGFYQRISRERIKSINIDEEFNRFEIELNCTCSVNAFLWRADRLVVDIQDGQPIRTSEFEQPLAKVENPEVLFLDDSLSSGATPFEISEVFDDLLPPTTQLGGPAFSTDVIEEITSEVSGLQNSLFTNLETASSQGILERSSLEVVSVAIGSDDRIGSASGNLPFEGFEIQSTGLPLEQAARGRDFAQDGTECRNPTHFAVHEWGEANFLESNIPQLLSNLGDETKAVEMQDVEALAKAYLYFGFGREAQQILLLDGSGSSQRLALQTIAAIIDDEEPMPPLVIGQQSCDTDVALWAFLSNRGGRTDMRPNSGAILRAFRKLPLQLQIHLAPKASSEFTRLGDISSASQVLASSNGQNQLPIENIVARSEVDFFSERTKDAIDDLSTEIAQNVRLSPDALVHVLNYHLDEGIDVSPDTMALSQAIRFENEGLEVSTKLSVLEVKSHIQSQRFPAALSLIATLKQDLPDDEYNTLVQMYVQSIVINGTDEEFVSLAFASPQIATPELGEMGMADRLVTLGLENFIPGAEVESHDQRHSERGSLAEIDHNEGQNTVSPIASVNGLPSQEIHELVSNSRHTPLEFGPTQSQPRFSDLDQLLEEESPLLLAMRSLTSDIEEGDEFAGNVLATGRDLLGQSVFARDTAISILERYPPVAEE